MKLSLESAKYATFKKKFKNGEFKGQRLGQAFYNHFELHKVSNQEQFNDLYELDDVEAVVMINLIFDFS